VYLVAEHHLGEQGCKDMQARLRKLGRKSLWAPAVATGKAHDRAWTAGVAAIVPSKLRVRELGQGLHALGGRWLFFEVDLRGFTLPIMVGYGFATGEVDPQNATWLAAMGAAIRSRGLPALAVADWNFTPPQLAATGWQDRLGMRPLGMPGVSWTCASGSRRLLDYAVATGSLHRVFSEVELDTESPTRPHSALTFHLAARPHLIKVWGQKLPRTIPLPRPGPRRREAFWANAKEVAERFGTPTLADYPASTRRLVSVHPRGSYMVELGAKISRWTTTLEVQAAAAADIVEEHLLRPHLGRGRPPAFGWLPAVATGPRDLRGLSGPMGSWATLAARLREVGRAKEASSDFAVEAVSPQLGKTLRFLAGWRPPVEPNTAEDGDGGPHDEDFCFDFDDTPEARLEGARCWQADLSDLGSKTAGEIEQMAEEADGHVRRLKTARAREANKSWREWLAGALRGGGGAAHRLAAGKKASALTPEEGQETMEGRVGLWSGLWQRDKEKEAHLDRLLEQFKKKIEQSRRTHGQDQLTKEQVKRAGYKLRQGTGLGIDVVTPSMLRAMDEEGWDELTTIFQEVEQHMVWPILLAIAKVCFPQKPQGGERPICLLNMLYRVWALARRGEVSKWDEQHRGPWDFASPGRSALQGAAEMALEFELASWKREHMLAMLVDAEKFYDHVGWDHLLADADERRYPPLQLVLAIEMARAPRYLSASGAVSATAVDVFNSLAAGCTYATSEARLFLFGLLSAAQRPLAGLKARQYVDDLLSTARAQRGFSRTLAPRASKAFLALLRGLEARGCKVSQTKTVILGTSSRITNQVVAIVNRAGFRGIKQAKVGKDLGVEVNMGRRRVAAVIWKRIKGASARSRKAGRWAKQGFNTAKLQTAGASPASRWGGAVHGLSPGMTRRLRSDAAAASGLFAPGRCATSALRLAFRPDADPAVGGPLAQVKLWFQLLWARPDLREDVSSHWQDAVALLGRKDRWRIVRGPLSATVATLLDQDFTLHGPVDWLDPFGSRWCCEAWDEEPELGDFFREFEAMLDRRCWAQAAQHHHGRGLGEGLILHKHRSMLAKVRRQDPPKAGRLVSAWLGGLWGEARRHGAGYRPDGICQRCLAEVDTDLHMIWSCPCNREVDDPAMANSRHLESSAAEGARSNPALWLRGALGWAALPRRAAEGEQAEEAKEEGQASWAEGAGEDTLCLATDGSGLGHRGWPSLLRCGWGWLSFCSSSGDLLFGRSAAMVGPQASVGASSSPSRTP